MRQSYGDATGHIFVISAVVAVVALLCVVFIHEVPLRTTVRIGESTGNASAAEAVTASPVEEGPSDTTAPAAVTPADTVPVTVGVHRARLANPERIQASSMQLDDPLERTAVAALDVLTAAQDTARRHVTASRAARAEVDALLGSVGAEVDVALTQLHRTLADIRARLLSDEVTTPSEGRDGTGADSLRSYEYGLLLNTQQTVEGMTTAAQREAQRILDLANAEVAALEQRIERLRSVEADMQAGIAEGLRGNAVR